ncbi:MAG: hypothetical protein U0132_20645 [Gemmatimonadaceae bacterium]
MTALLLIGCIDSTAPAPTSRLSDATPLGAIEAATSYVVEPLPGLPNGGQTGAGAINAAGDVAGFASALPTGGSVHAVIWQGMTLIDIGQINGLDALARSINDVGTVVGQTFAPAQDSFIWTASSGMAVLPGILLFDVNNSNVSVGLSQGHAIVRLTNGTILDIHPNGYINSRAMSISDNGWIAGLVTNAFGVQSAARWSPSRVFQDLGVPAGYTLTGAYAINGLGTAVGSAWPPPKGVGDGAPLVWTLTGVITRPNVTGVAWDISDRGRIAGTGVVFTGGPYYAAVTSKGASGIQILPTVGPYPYGAAYGVNRCGSIAGNINTQAVRWKIVTCDP